MKHPFIACWAAAALLLGSGPATADPLQRAARTSSLAAQRLITGVSQVDAGRLVAVGQRGHVLLSEDAGQRWQQAEVPLSSDLTAVQFPSPRVGFAVGHDGVVLVSRDAGQRWTPLLNGNTANALALEQFQAAASVPDRERLLTELQRNVESGPDKPFLDVHFINERQGFVVGAYNLVFETADGGQTWQSRYHQTDNAQSLLNHHAIRHHRGRWFIAGEAGLLMRLDPAQQRFVRLASGYSGSFFGLLDAGDALIAFGMRGNAVISRDAGDSWQPLVSGLKASITASARGADGSLWLADQLGNVVVSRDAGERFQPVRLPMNQPVAALWVTDSQLVLGGARGVRSLPLPKE